MIQLFDYNMEAYQSVVQLLEEENRAAIIHPTGTGKSFIGFKLCEEQSEKRICWLSPSEYIYKTQLENLEMTGSEIPENIEFYTYARLMMLSQEEIEKIQPDFIILDEFHRCGAQMWGQGVKRVLTYYKEAKILGLSATHIRYLDNQRNMADELFDGNIASEMSLGEAMVRGILPTPTYITSLYSYKEQLLKYEHRIQKTKSRHVRDQAERHMEILRRTLNKAEGLDEIFGKHMEKKGDKYIVFCANREHMEEMIQKVPAWFQKVDSQPRVYTVFTDSPDRERDFQNFKSDTSEHLKLLFCIDMLNEGVHVDGIAGVIMFRPTVSPIVYKQQIGRALSAASKGQPIIFDIVNNVESLYSIGAIEEEMKEATAYLRDNEYEERIVAETFDIYEETHDCKKLFQELNEILTTSWEQMYEYAREYELEHGDLNVPVHYKTREGYALGRWISVQRQNKKEMRVITAEVKDGGLSEARVEKLEAIGMIWNIHEYLWEKGLEASSDYYKEHGHLQVGSTYVNAQGYRLGAWLVAQKRMQKEGKLSSEQVKQLEACGMSWVNKYEAKWNAGYEEAKRYYEAQGNLDVPVEYITDTGFNLGDWLANHRGKSEIKLTKERQAMLDAIGMVWNKREPWDVKYQMAKKYYEQNGHLQIPAKYVVDGVWLNKWVNEQKQIYIGNRPKKVLSEEQVRKMEEIGMVWYVAAPKRCSDEYGFEVGV